MRKYLENKYVCKPGKILVFKEKHSTRYFDMSTVENRNGAFLKLFKERKNDGWYRSEEIVDVDENNIETIIEFFDGRSDYEYERFYTETLEKV